MSVEILVLKKGMPTSRSQRKVIESIKQWQQFLCGRYITDNDRFVVDGIFGNKTEEYTVKFQNENCLVSDGIVGPMTLAKAMELGYGTFEDPFSEHYGPSWPQKPEGMSIMTQSEKMREFGEIRYKSSGTTDAVAITNGWVRENLVKVNVPQLKGIVGAPSSCDVFVNKKIADSFVDLWKAWEKEGKLHLILTWAGCWAPRFVRGSKKTLSSHAWATAFDINAQWNMMGHRSALVGEKGSVRELVEIAVEHGFYWGGWISRRPDGMHFEKTLNTC